MIRLKVCCIFRDEPIKFANTTATAIGRKDQHPRFGYRRIEALLRREGRRVNRKRIYRLWRQHGLKVPGKQRKKWRLGCSANGCVRRQAEHANHVWAWDFVHDRTSDGRPLKWLTVMDEYTRECVALEVRRGMTAKAVGEVLAGAIRARGTPEHMRSDNGPEFIAQRMRAWLAAAQIQTLYIEPGSPWENGYAESFNSKLRDELLNAEEFSSLLEAQVLAKAWKEEYNGVRPHSALAYRTPAEYGASCLRADSPAPGQTKDAVITINPTLTATGT